MKNNIEKIFSVLRSEASCGVAPSINEISKRQRDPFIVLISTMISSRTKDEVTLKASERLFKVASTPEAISRLPEQKIAELIFPAGFFREKARNIKKTALLLYRDGGRVPHTTEGLLKLPGVGRKTANLVLFLGFGIDAICVDTHVHRISNRLGWVHTKTPKQTETALTNFLPQKYWGEINWLMVSFGKRICTPLSPFCSTCKIESLCEKRGVKKYR